MPWMTDGTLTNVYNHPKMKKLRKAFIDGEQPEECSWCWSEEEAGVKSFRQTYLERNLTYNIEDPIPQILDIKLNNVCNLKCRMCGHQASSLILKEDISTGQTKARPEHDYWLENKIIGTDNEDEFFNRWLPNIKELELTGGEPFASAENKALLARIVESGHAKNIKLLITTNATFYIPRLLDDLNQFAQVTISFSVDDIGKRLEYARSGANWELIKQTLLKFKTNYPKFKGSIYRTINNFNIYYLDDLDTFAMENNYPVVNGLLHEPPYLCIQNLPEWVKNEVNIKFRNSNTYSDILSFMNSAGHNMLVDFYNKTKFVDSIRQESFSKTFDEWAEILCYDNT